MDDILKVYVTQKFDDVAALASRLIARRASSFRGQQGFKLLRQTNVALCRIKDINIVDVIETFRGTIPDLNILENGRIDLPTKDNFEYLMIRLQSMGKLLCRIIVCAKTASHTFLHYIHRNFFLEASVVFIGLLSQIVDIAHSLCKETIKFYNALYLLGKYFVTNKKWLPADYQLPQQLETILGDDWKVKSVFSNMKGNSISSMRISANDMELNFDEFNDDTETEISTNKKADEANKAESKKVMKQELATVELVTINKNNTSNDLGVPISRETLSETLTLDSIKTNVDINKFIQFQRTWKANQLTNNEWKDLQLKTRHLLINNQERKCITQFKSLWQDTKRKKSRNNYF